MFGLFKTKIKPNFCKVFYSVLSKEDTNLQIKGVSLQNYIKHLEQEYELKLKDNQHQTRLFQLQPLINVLKHRKSLIENLENLSDLLNSSDESLKKLAEEEKEMFVDSLQLANETLLEAILPKDKDDDCSSIVLEINAGIGGQEAMLFASEIFQMYTKLAENKGWSTQIADYASTEKGGIRHGSLFIDGPDVFRFFKNEAGVHRVQRIPATEKAGRIHTSTVSVLALPQPSDIDIKIDNKDLKIETKRASGAGGQHVNTTDSAIRITHLPTGIVVDCQIDRSQLKNRKLALTKLRALLYERELETQNQNSDSLRKSQVRSNARNEKIRTYNFPQDRVSDHRLQGSNFHNIKGFLQGQGGLEELMNELDYKLKVDGLLDIIRRLNCE